MNQKKAPDKMLGRIHTTLNRSYFWGMKLEGNKVKQFLSPLSPFIFSQREKDTHVDVDI